MTLKFTSSDDSAYEVAIGATAEDAVANNLAVVEMNFSTSPPSPIYGRYKDAPSGSGLGVTVDKSSDTKVIGGGSLGIVPPASPDKGSLVNLADPFVRGEFIHADGTDAPVRDIATEEKEEKTAADEAGTLASTARPGTKRK